MKAFTLAEVLITLSIIGVVAAMTIPTLTTNIENTVIVTQLKKTYTMLISAFHIASTTDYNNTYPISGVATTTPASIYQMIKPYLKISKECNNSTDTSCGFLPVWCMHKRDTGCSVFAAGPPRVLLADGSAISFTKQSTSIFVSIDVNGPQKPNRLGFDIFSYQYYATTQDSWGNSFYYGVYPLIIPYWPTSYNHQCILSTSHTGLTCSAYIFKDGWKITYDKKTYK